MLAQLYKLTIPLEIEQQERFNIHLVRTESTFHVNDCIYSFDEMVAKKHTVYIYEYNTHTHTHS